MIMNTGAWLDWNETGRSSAGVESCWRIMRADVRRVSFGIWAWAAGRKMAGQRAEKWAFPLKSGVAFRSRRNLLIGNEIKVNSSKSNLIQARFGEEGISGGASRVIRVNPSESDSSSLLRWARLRILAGIVLAVSCVLGVERGHAESPQRDGGTRAPLEVLIFAPHPDDEVIGCAAVVLRAHARQQRAGVVLLTNGDGFPAIAAVVARKDRDALAPEDFLRVGALRQQHSLNAAARLGLNRDEVIFLGYPDSGLETIYQQTDSIPFEQKFTKKHETYGATVRDYHSIVHGQPAPYLKASVIDDIAEIIRDRQPKEIYVTNEADVHSDHRAAPWFVRDAARAANYRGPIFTYVVHGKPLPLPPDRNLTLTKEETETKHAALEDHQAGTSPIHDQLADEYTKPEETFWLIRAEAPAPK